MDNKKIDVTGCTREQVENTIKAMGGIFTREEYPSGKCPTYRVCGGDQIAMVYGGLIYISPRGQFHSDVRDDLRENRVPVALDD